MNANACNRSTVPDFESPAYWSGTIKMSLSKFFILRVLHDRPMHGYEIAQQVKSVTRGCCSPGEGTIYPVLRQYEQGGYVSGRSETVSGRERRVYALTGKGRRALQVAIEAWLEASRVLLTCQDLASGTPPAAAASRGRARS